MIEGILLIDKPQNWTSFDVVNYIRKIVAKFENKKPKTIKVGHTGTLDPLATGLLVILIGKKYTKQAINFSKLDKKYIVTVTLGSNSSSDDAEGQKTLISNRQPSLGEIEKALATFSGNIMQKPPIYSAIKINGQRAYKLARAGNEIELEARPVTIYSNTLQEYKYPIVNFISQVSSGTYIRSLAYDIGEYLSTGAYMSGLCRTEVGAWKLEDACEVEGIDINIIKQRLIS